MLWSALPEDLPGRPGADTARFSEMDSGEACFLTSVALELISTDSRQSLPHWRVYAYFQCYQLTRRRLLLGEPSMTRTDLPGQGNLLRLEASWCFGAATCRTGLTTLEHSYCEACRWLA